MKKYLLDKKIERKAKMLSLAGDPTRLRILCFMFDNKEACVSQIAESLDMSVASISHHLQIMKEHGLFETERTGVKICYKLVQQVFTDNVKEYVCSCE